MESNLRAKMSAYMKERNRRGHWKKAVAGLACLVVLVTAYALALPGITMTKDTVCGLEEHVHSEDCYTAAPTLTQPEPESEPEPEYVCGFEPHEHTADCLDENGEIICSLEVHVHSDTCLSAAEPETEPEPEPEPEPEKVLSCGLEEHQHTEQCFLPDAAQIADIPGEFVAGGTIENTEITWTLTKDDNDKRTLTISKLPDAEPQALPAFSQYGLDMPWRGLGPYHVVIEDGITEIGKYNFYNEQVESVSIGADVKIIRENAFLNAKGITDLFIPGTVKTLETNAFNLNVKPITSLVLEDGIESIGNTCFQAKDIKDPIQIPASVTSIGSRAFQNATAYVVAEGSNSFRAEDGVLYTKDMTELVDFPKLKIQNEYTVPASVKVIRDSALCYTQHVKKLSVPKTVETVNGKLAYNSGYEEIYIEDGTEICHKKPSDNHNFGMFQWFSGCKNLEKLHLPTDVDVCFHTVFDNGSYNAYAALTEITFPKGTSFLGQQAGFTPGKFPALEKIIYNAENAEIKNDGFLGDASGFILVIGKDATDIPANFNFLSSRAAEITFEPATPGEGGNWLHIEDGAMESAPTPFTGLSGTVYVDEKGVLYACAEDESGITTAKLIYCPPNITALTVATTITQTEGDPIPVTSIGQHALKYADLERISLDLTTMKTLEPYALSCPTLERVNDMTSYADVISALEDANVEVGYRALDDTLLTDAPVSGFRPDTMRGKKELELKKDNLASLKINVEKADRTELVWKPKSADNEEIGGYQLLTGETLTVTVAHGNVTPNRDPRYRVYFQLTDELGTLDYKPGEYDIDGQKVICCATEDPTTIYLEFIPTDGNTISIPVTVTYPSPGSSGGGLVVWGVILEKEAAEAKENLIVPPEGADTTNPFIQAWWRTEPVTIQVDKTANSANTPVKLQADQDGTIRMGTDPSWTIDFSHSDDKTGSYGKDLIRSVHYTDTITFPAGLSWEEDVIEAVKDGTIRRSGNILYAGDKKVLSVKDGGQLVLDEDGETIHLQWTIRNPSETTELGADSRSVTLYREAVAVKMDEFNPNDAVINNHVSATADFHYSVDQTKDDDADKPVESQEGKVELTKAGTNATYYGEDIDYTLTLRNTGTTPYTKGDGPHSLSDTLKGFLYITPENMQKMFDDDDEFDDDKTYGDLLTVTITGASLAKWQEVIGVDGKTTSWRHPGNSDMGDGGHTLTITKPAENQYQVVVDGDTAAPHTADSVAAALQAAGYGVTQAAVYSCDWQLAGEGETLTLAGGERHTFMLYATAKDTFGQLPDKDWPVSYFTDNPLLIENQATVQGVASSRTTSTSVKREASIDKQVSRDGTGLGDKPSVKDHDVLDYKLVFNHYGKGSYQDLPMVDDLYGNQYLMVPVDKNPQLKDNPDLDHIFNGHYILDHEGTYTNVVVGVDDEGHNMTAATVTVTMTDNGSAKVDGETRPYTGAHTQIKWYFPTLPGESYQKQVSYKALVDMGDSPTYTIGNIVWMNDKPGSRIYDSIWGRGGAVIDFDKKIVEKIGENPNLDELAPADSFHEEGEHSLVEPGKTVIYRLTLRSMGDGVATYTLNGTDLVDALPNTYGKFKWELGENVKFLELDTADSGTTLPVIDKMDQWYIAETYGDDKDAEDGLQYIRWLDTSSITFTGGSSIALYFELTFPDNKEGGAAVWDDYEAANNGNMVDNIMYVYDFPSMVHHDLESQGEPMLQKGVYRFCSSTNAIYGDLGIYDETGHDRQHYENQDSRYHNVTYYVALYNDGYSRMYLSDLQDLLPEGFRYGLMVKDGSMYKSADERTRLTTIGGDSLGKYPLVEFGSSSDENHTVFRTATITAEVSPNEPTPDQPQRITFHIDGGTGEYAVKFDSEKQQYYLDKDEAIVFGYIVDTGLYHATEDEATNVIAMPYTDYQNIGLTEQSSTTVTAPKTERYQDTNDGNRLIETSAKVEEDYGFSQDGETPLTADQWLVSDVTVKRGEIVPGIAKFTTSYVTENGAENPYTNSAPPTAQVNWKVTMTNSGAGSITDYTLTDTMPNPYRFTGTIAFKIYDGDDRVTLEKRILEFTGERTENDQSLDAENLYDNRFDSPAISLPMNDTQIPLNKIDNGLDDLSVSIDRNDAGNEVLKIHFEGAKLSIPERGRVEVVFSSVNPTNEYVTKVYTNFATLTPNHQAFTKVGSGQDWTDADDKHAVRSFSPVAVNIGYSTESSKRVVELDRSGAETKNTAISTDPNNNFIVLPQQDSEFRYTLTVKNNASKAMQRLIIIDNLPEVGDHAPFHLEAMRNSEFKVCLTDDPNFQIKITYLDDAGNPQVYILNPETDYTIQFSTDVDFGGGQSADWHGHDVNTKAEWIDAEAWGEDLSAVRSIRAMIRGDLDPENPVTIPPNAIIEVSFNARVEGEAEPGAIAWNNFGYHYHLKDEEAHLEAMPLVVGVQVPSMPTLEKKLVDASGTETVAHAKRTFSFMVYTGEALEGSFDTAEAWKAALTAAGRTYKQYDLTVEKGQTSSGKVPLGSDNSFEWTEGQKYTIVELPSQDSAYQFQDFNNEVGNSYTFTYHKEQNTVITCENQPLRWSAKLLKKDGNDRDKLLPGAVFGLYSPNSADLIAETEIPTEYKDLDLALEIKVGASSWYLTDLQTSDENGALNWDDLIRPSYYLLEVKAPDGYELNDEQGTLIDRAHAAQGLYTGDILNYTDGGGGGHLPDTGGMGTTSFYVVGGVLVAGAGALLVIKKRKNQDAEE